METAILPRSWTPRRVRGAREPSKKSLESKSCAKMRNMSVVPSWTDRLTKQSTRLILRPEYGKMTKNIDNSDEHYQTRPQTAGAQRHIAGFRVNSMPKTGNHYVAEVAVIVWTPIKKVRGASEPSETSLDSVSCEKM
jgi:hypothetical protein